MKYDELFEFTRPKYREDAESILENNGWELLGQGEYADVYTKQGKPYVSKLFSSNDAAYKAYINLISKYQNEHFPKIYELPRPLGRGSSSVSDEDSAYQYVDNNLHMKEALNLIAELVKNNRDSFFVDLHAGNLMMRGSTVVIIDPIAFNDET